MARFLVSDELWELIEPILPAIVRKIDGTTGMVTTLAGTGEIGYSGDGGPGNKAMLRELNDVSLYGKEGLLIADIQDQRIRRVDLRTGMITTFAGTGEKSRDGDGRRADEASLMGPGPCVWTGCAMPTSARGKGMG
jgi:hypothetical protein